MRTQNMFYAIICNVLMSCSLQAGILFKTQDEILKSAYNAAYQGQIPVETINKIDPEKLNEPRNSVHMYYMLAQITECLKTLAYDIENNRNETIQNEHCRVDCHQNANTQIQARYRLQYSDNIKHKNPKDIVTRWVRNTLYSVRELPNDNHVGLDILQLAAEQIEDLITWLSQCDFNGTIKHGDAQDCIQYARKCKEIIRSINRDTYSRNSIPSKTIQDLPLWTQYSITNNNLSRATYGIFTIPRIIGITLATGTGYGTYRYLTSR